MCTRFRLEILLPNKIPIHLKCFACHHGKRESKSGVGVASVSVIVILMVSRVNGCVVAFGSDNGEKKNKCEKHRPAIDYIQYLTPRERS